MDLERIWKKDSGEDEHLASLLQQAQWGKGLSKLPLQKIKKALLAGMIWALLITIGYAVLFSTIIHWQVRLAVVVVSMFNLIILWDSWRLYRSLQADITPFHNLRQELQKNYDGFVRWWRIQKKVSLFVYPIAITGGFLLGGTVGSGKAVEVFLYQPKILIALGICLLVLVPVCYYLARWMFNYAYGRHLKRLKATIDELEDESS